MSYKYIDVTVCDNHYKQKDDRWGELQLDGDKYTIGQVGCALTCAAMIEGITPKSLYVDYEMTDELVDWSKLPTYSISHKAISDSGLFSDLFEYIVQPTDPDEDPKPIILLGDDGKGAETSTHFVVVSGFKGWVAVDADGGIMYAKDPTDFSQFKINDPLDKYSDLKKFKKVYNPQSYRVPNKK